MLKLVIDENISFAEEAFSDLGQIKLMHGRNINHESLRDADALIIRSVTQVNKSLLDHTPVKFVGTATIGTDHVDLDYLKQNNIHFASAKGCNADAVAEYVFTAIFHVLKKKGISLKNKTLGVIGIGNIGSRVVHMAKALGLNVIENDPPLERISGNKERFHDLSYLLSNSDIITLHVPLNLGGIDNTFHLLNRENLELLKKDAVLINASRGSVLSNQALISKLNSDKNISLVLDVWENEPGFDLDLLRLSDIGTPHIAGYTLEGKINGTVMIYQALCRFLNLKPDFIPVLPPVPYPDITLQTNTPAEEIMNSVCSYVYDITEDDKLLRKTLHMSTDEKEKYFDSLRKDYKLRREFNNYKVKLEPFSPETGDILKAFRFKLH